MYEHRRAETEDAMTAKRDPQGSSVHTGGRLRRVPNAPKTPIRGFRIPADLYDAAKEVAAARGEDLSSVVRAALERYVKRNKKKDSAED